MLAAFEISSGGVEGTWIDGYGQTGFTDRDAFIFGVAILYECAGVDSFDGAGWFLWG